MISPPDSPHQLLQTGSQSSNAQSITTISLTQSCFGCHVSPFLLASPAPFSPAPKCNVLNPSNMSALTSDWLTGQEIRAAWHPLLFFLYDVSVYDERRDKLLKPSAGGSRVIPPDKQTSLCLCVPQSNTNKANIDDTKWHRSYADLCRSMWLHCGLLDKQAAFYSPMHVRWCAALCWEMREARQHRTRGRLRGERGLQPSRHSAWMLSSDYVSMHTCKTSTMLKHTVHLIYSF